MDASLPPAPYGTLDLMILKTLETLGPPHDYDIARRIGETAEWARTVELVNHLRQGGS